MAQVLEKTEDALRDAMQNLLVSEVTPGVFWLQVPEAELYILCGCPGEVVKHPKTGEILYVSKIEIGRIEGRKFLYKRGEKGY